MKKEKIAGALLLCLWLAFVLPILGQRMAVEKNYRAYETLVNYEDFKSQAFAQGQSVQDYFKELAQAGATTVTVGEATINSLKVDPESTIETSMNGINLRVKGSNEELAFIKEGLKCLKEEREIKDLGPGEIEIQGKAKDLVLVRKEATNLIKDKMSDRGEKTSILEYVGLGYQKDLVEGLKAIPNLNVNLTPTFIAGVQDDEKSMDRFMASLEDLSRGQHFVLFPGNTLYGAGLDKPQDLQDRFAQFLAEKNLALVLMEDITQRGNMPLKGGEDFIKRSDVKKARCLITWDFLQKHYDYEIPFHHHGEELTNVYYRAISERNMAMVMTKPFMKNNLTLPDSQVYAHVLGSLNQRLENMHYQKGQVQGMDNFKVAEVYKILPSILTVLGGILLLDQIFGLKKFLKIGIFILGSGLAFGIFGLNKATSFGDLIFNLANIIVFPSLALAFLAGTYDRIKEARPQDGLAKIYGQGAWTLALAVGISMIGALNEVVFLASTDYMMEINIFRGVKISQVLPLALALLIFARKIYLEKGQKMGYPLCRDLLLSDVKIWQACLAGMGVIVLGIFLLRGGNTSSKVPGVELLVRNLFENLFYARPRTKAVFIGFPAIVLLVYGAHKNLGKVYAFICFMLAAIGMVDITNTFSHIRTPLMMSFARVGIEYLGALLVGGILFCLAHLLYRRYHNYDQVHKQ